MKTLVPELRDSKSLDVSEEQKHYIKQILDLTSSDSMSAKKAYDAINYILTQEKFNQPVIDSLEPTSTPVGSPAFLMKVHGQNFDPNSKIMFGSVEQLTTFMAEDELHTTIDVGTSEIAAAIPVQVDNQGIVSNVVPFAVTGLKTEAKK
jgi:IPT/TIG domain-containing protein